MNLCINCATTMHRTITGKFMCPKCGYICCDKPEQSIRHMATVFQKDSR
jgi:predicted RNA-binding Zn-ribbon protein involved in translation (DUF1610 family)